MHISYSHVSNIKRRKQTHVHTFFEVYLYTVEPIQITLRKN